MESCKCTPTCTAIIAEVVCFEQDSLKEPIPLQVALYIQYRYRVFCVFFFLRKRKLFNIYMHDFILLLVLFAKDTKLYRTFNFCRTNRGKKEQICIILAYFFLRNFLLYLFLCQTTIIILNSIERKETNKKNASSPNVEQLIFSD